jgi:hypothetical protein
VQRGTDAHGQAQQLSPQRKRSACRLEVLVESDDNGRREQAIDQQRKAAERLICQQDDEIG